MFNNISNPKWFGDWSRLEDEYLDNNFTEIQDNFAFSKRKKTNGLFGAIVSLATAFPVRDPETGHATGAWKVACESIDLDEVPLSDIADMISCFGSKTITDFQLYNREVDITPWQQALGELLLRLRIEKDDYQWIQCPNSESAVNMMNMVMDAHMPKDFFDGFVCGDEEEWCRDFFRVTDSLCPDGCSEKSILVRPERNLLMALTTVLVEWMPRKDLSINSLFALLSLAEKEDVRNYKPPLDFLFEQIETGYRYSGTTIDGHPKAVPSLFCRNSDARCPAKEKWLEPVEDFALQCYQSVRQLSYADYTVIVSSLTSRLIDFKYLREAEAPAYTHGVSNDTFDYEFDDDDDDIPAFSFPEA